MSKTFEYIDTICRGFDNFKKALLQENNICNFLENFQFETLPDINIFDVKRARGCLDILSFLFEFETFFDNRNAQIRTLDFILINLSISESDSPIVRQFLEVLNKFIVGFTTFNNNYEAVVNILNPRRILVILADFTKICNLDDSTKTFCGCILKRIFTELNEHLILDTAIKTSILELFHNFNSMNAVGEICIISEFLIERFQLYSIESDVVVEWITEKAPSFLSQNDNEVICAYLIKFIDLFCQNVEHLQQNPNIVDTVKNFNEKLMKASNKICLAFSNPTLSQNCANILNYLLNEFYKSQQMVNIPNFTNDIMTFDLNIMNWPEQKNEMVFCVFHIVVAFSEPLWDSLSILISIADYFYSFHSENSFILKSIYCLFAMLYKNVENRLIRALGPDLINHWTCYRRCLCLNTLVPCQFEWVLLSRSESLKTTVLRIWFEKWENLEEIFTIIGNCNAYDAALQVLITDTLENDGRIAAFIRDSSNRDFRSKIAFLLPKKFLDRKVLHFLLSCRPMVPKREKYAILLCAFMSALIPILDDEDAVYEACNFTKRLLRKVENNPAAVMRFCENPRNVQYLFSLINRFSENTGLEVLRLLSNLVEAQNRSLTNVSILVDFSQLLETKSVQVGRKTLLLLNSVVTSKVPLFKINDDAWLPMYLKILDYLYNPETTSTSSVLLGSLLMREPWLGYNALTSCHIDRLCMQSQSTRARSVGFLLKSWCSNIQKVANGFYMVPKKSIRSFCRRF